jgi:uncharacterized membrane protein
MANLHVIAGSTAEWTRPIIRNVGAVETRDALAKGVGDFLAMPSHLFFLRLIYPVVSVPLAASIDL